MAVFGVLVESSELTRQYFTDVKERLNSDSMLKNPFIGDVKRHGDMYVINMRPLYPNFSPFFWLAAAGVYYVWGFSTWLVAPVLLGCTCFFWSSYFFYFMLKAGLKKAGYLGSVKMLRPKDVLDSILFGTKKVRR